MSDSLRDILQAESSLWVQAGRAHEQVLIERKKLSVSEHRLNTLTAELDNLRRAKPTAISGPPLPADPQGTPQEKMSALERAFGLRVSRVGKNKLKINLSFTPNVPSLRIVLDVGGKSLGILECSPIVVGMDKIAADVDGAREGQLATFIAHARARYRKQRA